LLFACIFSQYSSLYPFFFLRVRIETIRAVVLPNDYRIALDAKLGRDAKQKDEGVAGS